MIENREQLARLWDESEMAAKSHHETVVHGGGDCDCRGADFVRDSEDETEALEKLFATRLENIQKEAKWEQDNPVAFEQLKRESLARMKKIDELSDWKTPPQSERHWR